MYGLSTLNMEIENLNPNKYCRCHTNRNEWVNLTQIKPVHCMIYYRVQRVNWRRTELSNGGASNFVVANDRAYGTPVLLAIVGVRAYNVMMH
jgi:hypothetical protein